MNISLSLGRKRIVRFLNENLKRKINLVTEVAFFGVGNDIRSIQDFYPGISCYTVSLGTKRKKKIDTQVAFQCVEISKEMQLDYVVLFTGDRDYVWTLQSLVMMDIKTVLVHQEIDGYGTCTSPELKKIADICIPIDSYFL